MVIKWTSDFRECLEQEMRAQHVSACELSRRTGLTAATIHYYRTGKRFPTLASVLLILDAFGKNMVVTGGGVNEEARA